MNPDGSDVARLDPSTADLQSEREPDWSPDGARVAYSRGGTLTTIRADGTARAALGGGSDPAWSPDATRLAFMSGGALHAVNADGTGETVLVPEPHCDTIPEEGASCTQYDDPAWAPDGSGVAHAVWVRVFEGFPRNSWRDSAFYIGGAVFVNDAMSPDWSPDSGRLAFVAQIPEDVGGALTTSDRDGSDRATVREAGCPHGDPAWSPDGTRIAFAFGACGHGEDSEIYVMNADGTNVVQLTDNAYDDRHPSWQPIPVNGYPRPKAAPLVATYLVPAYEACSSPNRTHGPPLAFGSCSPPVKSSLQLTVGTPDSNSLPARHQGYLRLKSVPGDPSTPADEADVQVRFFSGGVFTDALVDYAGELRASVRLRITDKDNTPHPGGPGAGTVQDFTFDVDVPCAPVADPQDGSVCEATTTAETLIPGAIKEGRRAIWQLGQAVVYDGGIDGDPATEPNTVFARQGVFIP